MFGEYFMKKDREKEKKIWWTILIQILISKTFPCEEICRSQFLHTNALALSNLFFNQSFLKGFSGSLYSNIPAFSLLARGALIPGIRAVAPDQKCSEKGYK